MTKILKTLIIFFGLLINNVYANIQRPTTFDERQNCEKSNGMWRDFGNSCAGSCESKLDKFAVCSYAITFGCDCGENRCYYEDKCISLTEYIKIYEQKLSEDQKISDEYKNKRKEAFKKFQNNYINKLAGIFGQDPNYIHNYPRQPRPLAQNEFKNTNRLLIYNEIIKKKNERNAELKKKYDDELNKIKEDQEKSIAEKEDLIKKINEEKSKLKVISEFKEVEAVKEDNKTNNKSKKSNENDIEKEAIISDLVNNSDEEAPVKQQLQTNDYQDELEAINKPKIIYSNKVPNKPKDYLQKINDVANNIVQNNLDVTNNNYGEVPPLYIKQQNGDQDFTNKNIIENTTQIPQFEN